MIGCDEMCSVTLVDDVWERQAGSKRSASSPFLIQTEESMTLTRPACRQLVNSVYFDNRQMQLYHGRMDKTPGAIALRLRWYPPAPAPCSLPLPLLCCMLPLSPRILPAM